MAANAPSHTMKKLINKVDDLVPESLAGLGAAHPDLVKIDAANNVVLRAGGLSTPMQFGPQSDMPASRQIPAISLCNFSPSLPSSANPPS